MLAAADKLAPPSVHLLDLDEEVLASALAHLTAQERGMATKICKLFALILAELAMESPYLMSVVDKKSPVECLASLTLRAPPSAGVLFANIQRDLRPTKVLRKMNALVRRLPPAMHLVGGEVHERQATEPAPSPT